jgi:hypothetical protein
MEHLLCPSCGNDFGVKNSMCGTDVRTCVSCGTAYVVMYVAGFNDGLRASNAKESQKPAHNIAMVPCSNHAAGECCEAPRGVCGAVPCSLPAQHHS